MLGWSTRDANQPGMRYLLASTDAGDVAGVLHAPDDVGIPPVWIGGVAVGDVDDAVARMTESGGSVHRAPADIPGVGRFAIVTDPQGAALALITGMSDQPSAVFRPGVAGHGGWHELYTTEWASAFDFYGAHFGWTPVETMDMGAMGKYLTFAAGGVMTGG